MFGRVIEKHCTSCKKDSTHQVSVGYSHDGVTYYGSILCPECNKDLAEEDRLVIQKARDEGKNVTVIMY